MLYLPSNSKLVLITGLPGSGKTTFAKDSFEDYPLVDDPKKKPVFEENKDYVIVDPNLVKREAFDKVNNLFPEAHWVFFKANNPIECWSNHLRRLERESYKTISPYYFSYLVERYSTNFNYYIKSVMTYQIQEVYSDSSTTTHTDTTLKM